MRHWHENPADVRPMLASLEEPPLAREGLVYEPKYDGIRALVELEPPAKAKGTPLVRLFSRNGRDKSAQFPALVAALATIARGLRKPLLLDGELVAVTPSGEPLGFQFIQGRIHLTAAGDIERAEAAQPAVLILFDLLRDGDEDLRGEPLAARRLRLQKLIKPRGAAARVIRLSEMAADDGRAMYARARREGWEGLIVKDAASIYRSGKRTPAWRKLKLLKQQEFVIGGWTEPRLSRQHFGALLVGYYGEDAALHWAGSVGTGFDQAELDRVAKLLAARETMRRPFRDAFKTIERQHWVRPDLVAEVRFTEWTVDGLLRQPVYLGMRTDKKAKDVTREEPAARVGSDRPAVPAAKGPKIRRRPAVRGARGSSGGADVHVDGQQALLDQLSRLEQTRKDGDLDLPGGGRLRVTNLAKVFWPELGITKGELLRYYVQVAPLILPVVDDRPLVMKRYPNGVDKPAFYQQRHPDAPPDGVRRAVLPPEIEPIDEEGPRDRLIGGGLATLLYMTQIAAISQDPWFSRVADPEHQDYAAIDLDPGPDATFDRVLQVARWVKARLDAYGIPGFPKTSGASGLHIYIPLPPKTTYETGQLLCRILATEVAAAHPQAATIERMVKKRGRAVVYVDYLQNILGKTLATAYSARASDYAGVSTPLTWDEVARGIDARHFTVRTAYARFQKVGDLWRALRTSRPVDLKRVIAKARR